MSVQKRASPARGGQPAPAGKGRQQRGGFVMGMIVGLLVGLALALAVALYVTKVPIPFVNKVPQRSAERDAEEREKNRNWDPNSPLYGGNPAKPTAPAATTGGTTGSGTVAPADPAASTPPSGGLPPLAVPPPAPTAPAVATTPASSPSRSARSTRDPAAILSGDAPAEGALSTRPREDPFIYFVQAGAFGRSEDAEQQRAKLAMAGIESRVTEREQAGRTVYRVRLGPFERREAADAAKERLESSSFEAALVRVQK